MGITLEYKTPRGGGGGSHLNIESVSGEVTLGDKKRERTERDVRLEDAEWGGGEANFGFSGEKLEVVNEKLAPIFEGFNSLNEQ